MMPIQNWLAIHDCRVLTLARAARTSSAQYEKLSKTPRQHGLFGVSLHGNWGGIECEKPLNNIL